MIQKGFTILALVICCGLYAQTEKLSATVSFPLPMGNNNFEKKSGKVDIGVQYRFFKTRLLHIGGSVNVGFYKYSQEEFRFKQKDRLLQPRVFGEFEFGKFRPFVALGYTFAHYNQEFDGGESPDVNFDLSGFNLNTGLSFDVVQHLFFIAQIDIVRLSDKAIFNGRYFSNISVVKFGLGYRF